MPNHKQRILAIDPGTKAVGFAFFEGSELIDYAARPIRRGRSIMELLTNIETLTTRLVSEKRPTVIVIEKDSFSQIRQNALLTLAIYKMKAVARRASVPVREIAPNTVRKVICGNGHATKRDVAKFMVATYPELSAYFEPSRRWRQKFFMHALDGIACGLAYLRKESPTHENK